MKVINYPFRGVTKIPGAELGSKYLIREMFFDKNHYFGGIAFKDLSREYCEEEISKCFNNTEEDILILGGDHSTTSKVFDILETPPVKVIVFDAHNDYEKEERPVLEYKNWNVLNHIKLKTPNAIIIGYRYKHTSMPKINGFTYIDDINFCYIENVMKELLNYCDKKETIYISIDMDVLSPFEFPGVGFACAGGITLRELIYCLNVIFKSSNRVILDIVEFNPLKENVNSVMILKRLYEEIKLLMKDQEQKKSIYNKSTNI